MEKPVPHISNYFRKGIYSDTDPQFQPPDTYRNAVNGRILFNSGGSYAFENDRGNKYSFTLNEYNGDLLTGYLSLGSANFADKVVIFSTNGENSEIGFLTIDDQGIGTYQQVFNDKYDPNGELLGFNINHNIEGIAVKETVETERVYWVDNFNQDSVINILLGADFFYTPTAGVYPYWYSVQSLRSYCTWQMGLIKYKERIAGNLKTGVYQYSYRMGTKDGYRTPWYPIIRHIFLTGEEIDAAVNYNYYQMNPSNIVTVYGNRLEIKGIDQKYPILEVAYIYSVSETQTVDASIFYTKTDYDNPLLTTETVDHTQHAGTPVALDEFNIKWFPVLKSKTIEEKDNYLFKGNVTEVGVLEPDVDSVVIRPYTKNIFGDSAPMNRTTVPVTEVSPSTTSFTTQSYAGVQETYDIVDDYFNYKGTQTEHSLKGYFRGETYRFGIILYDQKGHPNYVFHIQDYTFPEQYDPSGDYTLTFDNGGSTPLLRIMGMKIDNIKIPHEILYDEWGNINISGFSIVRAKRVPYTRFQGVIMNTVYENNDTEEDGTLRYDYTRPVPMTENYFAAPLASPIAGSYPNNAYALTGTKARGTNIDFANRSGTFLFYSPDILFGEPKPDWQENDRIKLVGLAATTDHQQNQPGYNKIYGSTPWYLCHYYSKNYLTVIPPNTTPWRPPVSLGDYSFIEQNKIYLTYLDGTHKIPNYDSIKDDLVYTEYQAVNFLYSGADCDSCKIEKRSWGIPASLLLLLKDFRDLGAGENDTRNRVFLANYQRPATSYFSGEEGNALENTLYFSTGHFQPINAAVIADTIDANGDLIFSDVEVWGGDCFVSLFDYTRLLPQYHDCETDGTNVDSHEDCYEDYSVSMVVPIETRLNIALRYGRQFARDGVEPEEAACGVYDDLAINGIQEKQREDFNINSVLQHEENIQFFNAKPTTIVNRKENPLTIIYSAPKYYGEPVDHYRRFYANQFLDLTGSNGGVTKLFSQYSYIYFLQTRGFGRLYINQPATLPSSEQGNIIVGSAGVLTGALYISQEIGCQNQFSVTTGNNQTYWVDVNLGKLYRFTQDGVSPISDLHGLHNKLYTACKYYHGYDAPNGLGGIHGVFDYTNNELVLTFKRYRIVPIGQTVDFDTYIFTVVYSENIDAFTTFFSEQPHFYFSLQGLYFSDSPNDIPNERGIFYAHLLGNRGEYYGILRNSTLELIVEPDTEIEKVYNGCRMNINQDGVDILSQCVLVTEKDNITLSLTTDTRKRYRHNYLEFPTRGLTQVDRVRGKYLSETFTISNADNKTCRVSGVEHKFGIGYSL